MDQNIPPIAQAPEIAAQVPPMAPPAKKGINKMVVIAVVAIIAVIIVAAVGLTMLNASANVNKTASEMTLKQSDFPSGWHASGTVIVVPEVSNADVGYAYTVYNNTASMSSMTSACEVSCQIIVYKSVGDAKADFTDLLKNGGYSMNAVSGHFDQCQIWQMNMGDYGIIKLYAFQEKNVIGVLTFTSVGGYNMTDAWINSMLDAQEAKIA